MGVTDTLGAFCFFFQAVDQGGSRIVAIEEKRERKGGVNNVFSKGSQNPWKLSRIFTNFIEFSKNFLRLQVFWKTLHISRIFQTTRSFQQDWFFKNDIEMETPSTFDYLNGCSTFNHPELPIEKLFSITQNPFTISNPISHNETRKSLIKSKHKLIHSWFIEFYLKSFQRVFLIGTIMRRNWRWKIVG